MQNPQMPNMPGAGAMSDSLEFVKNLWGNMGVPGISAPTLSVDDLDKKIKDLKAVEIWLNVNTSMVRGSIQALEVQRATLAALKSMGEAMAGQGNPFAAFAQQPPAQPGAAPAAAAAPSGQPQGDADKQAEAPADAAAAMGMANPAMWWSMMQEQFQHALAQAVSANAAAATAAPVAQDGGQPEDKPASGAAPSSKPRAKRKAD